MGSWRRLAPPLAYIRRGRPPPPFSIISLSSLSLFLMPRADSPCLGFEFGWEFSTIARRRSTGIGIQIGLLSAARLVRSPEGTSVALYVCNLLEALYLWCYFIVVGHWESPSPVVFYTTGRS